MTIGKRIRKLREEKELSQTKLAELTHSTKQTIYKYENDIITNIPINKIESIAKVLDTTPAYLMGWEENLTTENAAFTVDLLVNTELLNIVKKLNELTEENKKVVYDIIDFFYQKEGH